eukprot:TRINITY_DN3022_c0_g1_i7.p1 TRINITY_DN3022_c0_g1~~TRINITY_DN3022_c0_g1_i7.p1  ORF type:complete len:240 (+),score=89.29 TRINITY_DN3022_c0_g1_i7:62-781(+)
MEERTVTVDYQGEPVTVGRRLYVGNLPYTTRWQELKDLFIQGGANVVYANVKEDRQGRSAGCGIVEFATAREAANAMMTMNDWEIQGRRIFVRQDKDDRDIAGMPGSTGNFGGFNRGGQYGGRGRGGGKGGQYDSQYSGGQQSFQGGGGGGDITCRIFVMNLAWRTSWQDLKDYFRQIGDVTRADLFEGHDGRSKGSAVVEFSNPHDAQRAIAELNEVQLHGRPLFIREDRDGGAKGGY